MTFHGSLLFVELVGRRMEIRTTAPYLESCLALPLPTGDLAWNAMFHTVAGQRRIHTDFAVVR